MPRIMIECPLTHELVPTGYRTSDLSLDTMLADRSFRCGCGAVHAWGAPMGSVEGAGDLQQEIAAELRHLRTSLQPVIAAPDAPGKLQHRAAHEAQVRRDALHRPW